MHTRLLRLWLNMLWFGIILPVGALRRGTGRGLRQSGWVDVNVSTIDRDSFRSPY
jgi:hypothetical protein